MADGRPSGSGPFRDEVEVIALGRVVVPDQVSARSAGCPRSRHDRQRPSPVAVRNNPSPASVERPPTACRRRRFAAGWAEFSIGIPHAKPAKRKGSYVPENKQSLEIIDPNHIRIPTTYGRTSETLRFAGRNISFVFVAFRPPQGPNRTGPFSSLAAEIGGMRVAAGKSRAKEHLNH